MAFCSPRLWLPGNMADKDWGNFSVVLSCNNTLPNAENNPSTNPFALCCNKILCSNSCAKAVAPAWIRSNTACLLTLRPVSNPICTAHPANVFWHLQQLIRKLNTKWYGVIFLASRWAKPDDFPILLITDLSKNLLSFFYLGAGIAICRHCKMCLELQVAFPFKPLLYISFHLCG